MTKLFKKKSFCVAVSVMLLMSILVPLIEFASTPVSAFVLPPNQILPNTVEGGNGVYEKAGECVSAIDGCKYVVYRNTKLRPTAIETSRSAGHDFYVSRGRPVSAGIDKTKECEISIGVEVAGSLGVSVGVNAFDCEATVETEVTSALGIACSLGQGYTESLTYTLNPDTDMDGTYHIITNAFVRDYKIESYEWKQVQTGTRTVRLWYTLFIATRQEPVYEWKWVKKDTTKVCYPESYYYTLKCIEF